MRPYRLILGATGIEITQQPVATIPTEILTKHEIVGVFPVYNVKPTVQDENEWTYPYPAMTIINVTLADQSRVELELQECTNQTTWNL